jgi:hypothetical protein
MFLTLSSQGRTSFSLGQLVNYILVSYNFVITLEMIFSGTGKSVLLRRIIRSLKDSYNDPFDPSVAITASTGIAALNIGGRTLHSFAGIGLGKESAERLCKNLRSFARQRWKTTRVLIVDESQHNSPFEVPAHAN